MKLVLSKNIPKIREIVENPFWPKGTRESKLGILELTKDNLIKRLYREMEQYFKSRKWRN